MSYIKYDRGGVKVSFSEPLQLQSRVWCEITYPTYIGGELNKLPKVYWRSSGNLEYRVAPAADYILFEPGDTWIEFKLTYDTDRITAGNELDVHQYDGKFNIKLKPDVLDPQFQNFGERNYKLTYTSKTRHTGNGMTYTKPTDTGIGQQYPIPGQAMIAKEIWFKKALVKPRKLVLRDVANDPISKNTGLQALDAKYPVDEFAFKAPWSFMSSPGTARCWAIGNNMNPFQFIGGETTDGFVLPIGTRYARIEISVPAATWNNALAARQAQGWNNAATLFDEVMVYCYDHGPWAPIFNGKDLFFDDTPLLNQSYSNA